MDFDGIIKIPTLLDLAAMKTYALGGRAKWKDYVDLYFILKDHHSLKELSARAADIFGAYFNEKLWVNRNWCGKTTLFLPFFSCFTSGYAKIKKCHFFTLNTIVKILIS